MRNRVQSLLFRLLVGSVAVFAGAVILTASGGWRVLVDAAGFGDPDAQVTAPLIPMPGDSGVEKPDLSGLTEKGKELIHSLPTPVMPGNEADGRETDPKVRYSQALEVAKTAQTAPQETSVDYNRKEQFGDGWVNWENGCNTRQIILKRDLSDLTFLDTKNCKVGTGILEDPYTGKTIDFLHGQKTSQEVQIDHIIPLANAWRTGAQNWEKSNRVEFANDPDNLLAVDGPTNNAKGAKSIEEWLPPSRDSHCDYAADWVLVKDKWGLWMTIPEQKAAITILKTCQ